MTDGKHISERIVDSLTRMVQLIMHNVQILQEITFHW